MPRIQVTTMINAGPDVCFDAARDLDLHQRSMQHTGERVVAGRASGLIELDEEVTWEARHFGLMHRHTARITAFDRPRHFRDEMTTGRFKSFVHDHDFEAVEDGGTRMVDRLEFSSPFGVIGVVVDAVLLKWYLRRLLVRRGVVIKRVVETEAGSG